MHGTLSDQPSRKVYTFPGICIFYYSLTTGRYKFLQMWSISLVIRISARKIFCKGQNSDANFSVIYAWTYSFREQIFKEIWKNHQKVIFTILFNVSFKQMVFFRKMVYTINLINLRKKCISSNFRDISRNIGFPTLRVVFAPSTLTIAD